MRSEQPDSDDPKEESSFNDFDMDMNASQLITAAPRHEQAALVEKLNVKPGEQRRVALGSFTKDDPAKGFSIDLSPDPTPVDSIVTEVSSLGTPRRYRLVLHIANYGNKTVSAEVWRL
jgi:hypothetical protein